MNNRHMGPRKKIPHLACPLARLLRCIHRHVSRYASLYVPFRRTQIRRNPVELFLTVTLIGLNSSNQHLQNRGKKMSEEEIRECPKGLLNITR